MEAADLLLDPFRSGIGRRALAEVVLLACVCGPLGFWVVRFGMTYGAESFAHALLPGLVGAVLLGAPLVAGGAAGAGIAAVLIALAAREERIGPETGTAVVVTGMLGLGALLALSPEAPPRLEELLFGDPLAAGAGELLSAAALLLVGGVALIVLHRPLAAMALDPAGAAALGLRPGTVRLALLALTAAAVAVGAQGLGNLLILAVLVAPAAAVGAAARSPARAMLATAAAGSAFGIVGIYASFELGTAAGASVALALCLAALGGALPLRRARPGPDG